MVQILDLVPLADRVTKLCRICACSAAERSLASGFSAQDTELGVQSSGFVRRRQAVCWCASLLALMSCMQVLDLVPFADRVTKLGGPMCILQQQSALQHQNGGK